MGRDDGKGAGVPEQTAEVLAGDTAAALQFLSLWGQAPWALTAIRPDRKQIEGKTCLSLKDAAAFVDKHNGKMNIYFHVNPLLHAVEKKAEREDVKEVAWLHVDIDPRSGESISEEQNRALLLLTERLPKHVPPPTCIVFSGGGYQGFWKLITPIPINGNLALAEDAKLYNQFIELAFSADNCHNIDRIMRLPGTINLPNAQKLKKGRVPALARLVEFHPERTYPIEVFKKTPATQTAGTGDDHLLGTVVLQGEVPKMGTVDDLDEWGVADNVKIAIAQGSVPGQKVGDSSRSAWLFWVCCALIRSKVPDKVIFSVITDSSFGISESVLEKRSSAERYALRQIERAKEEVIDPALRKLNEKFAVIGNIGGKCRVIEEIYDPVVERHRLTWSSFEDFRNRHLNKNVKVGEKKDGTPVFVSLGQWWLTHGLRRQYEHLIFAPGRDVDGAYNLWRGFAVEPGPGDCSLYLEHMLNNICMGDKTLYDYLLRWMARAVQQPALPGEVAVVLRGGRGVGKGMFVKEFGYLFGRHFLHLSQSAHLVGNFNGHLRDAVVVFADEAYYAGDRSHVSVLNTLITESLLTVERKGIDVETAANCTHLMIVSNSDHIVPAGPDERRYFVLQTGDEHKQQSSYFGALKDQMVNGGRAALLRMLLELDISDFDPRNVPHTLALQEQKLFSMGTTEEWWYEKLVDGRIFREDERWREVVAKDDLVDDYVAHAERWRLSRRGNATALGRFLSAICPSLKSFRGADPNAWGQDDAGRGNIRLWEFGPLEEARAGWEKVFGKTIWPSLPIGSENGTNGKGHSTEVI